MPARKTRSISKKRLAELLSQAAVGNITSAADNQNDPLSIQRDAQCNQALQALAHSESSPENTLVPAWGMLSLLP